MKLHDSIPHFVLVLRKVSNNGATIKVTFRYLIWQSVAELWYVNFDCENAL